jgi:hypothetical protein
VSEIEKEKNKAKENENEEAKEKAKVEEQVEEHVPINRSTAALDKNTGSNPIKTKVPQINNEIKKEPPKLVEDKKSPQIMPPRNNMVNQFPPRGYDSIQPAIDPRSYYNPLLYGATDNRYLMYDPQPFLKQPGSDMCISPQFKGMMFAEQGKSPSLEKPFKKCSIHLSIAYFIQFQKKVEISNVLIGILTIN